MELIIDGHTISDFNNLATTLKFDSIFSTFSFDLLFDPENKIHKEIFKPGAYIPCVVSHNGERLITGRIINPSYGWLSKPELIRISGQSLSGVLDDCTVPISRYPIQHEGKSLVNIAAELCKPFPVGIRVGTYSNGLGGIDNARNLINAINGKVIRESSVPGVDKAYVETSLNSGQKIASFLAQLSNQRSIVLSHDVYGNIVFTKANTNQPPLYEFTGAAIGTSMSLFFGGKAMHSEITVVKQADEFGGNAGQATVQNPYVSVFRPIVIEQTSGDDVDTQSAAQNALFAELKNIKLVIKTDRWEIDGKVIKPNTIIRVKADRLFLPNPTNWFIESVALTGNTKATTATLDCVLPNIYNRETPENIFE